MKIVVIGGTGLIGSKLCAKLAARGQDVIAASPSSGVNSITGQGLASVLAGAQVVVDVSNAPSWDDAAVMKFFDTSTRNIIAAATAAAVRHYVALSVVGTERLQSSGYFRAKLAQEKLIAGSGIPYTIVRATQFFEFASGIAKAGTDGQTVRLPAALMQPMAADDVAAALAEYAVQPAQNRIVEVAGPEAMGIDEVVRKFLAATGDPRTVITDPRAPYYGIQVTERLLTPDQPAQVGHIHFDEWLRQLPQPATAAV